MSDEWETLSVEHVEHVTESDIERFRDHDRHREQPLGARAVDDLPEDVEEIPDEHILETSGLLSEVVDRETEVLGHIYMTEWDETENPMIPLSLAQKKPGISVVLRSSPLSYHLYNLSVRSFEEQIRDAAAGTGDLGHVRWAARRGYFALRVLPKFMRDSREEYKPAPEEVKVLTSESKFPQSERHLRFFEDLASEQGQTEAAERLETALDEHETIGERLAIDHYQTITDEAKEALGRV